MSKTVNSWSKPDEMPGLIARKQVDKSMFETGSHIPEAFREDFSHANHGDLPTMGESGAVILVHEGVDYAAKLHHRSRSDTGGERLELLYASGGPFSRLLRERLAPSYRDLVVDRPKERSPQSIPEEEREYVEFYETDQPYRYMVRLVARVPGFDQVWADLGRLLASPTVVATLSEGASNTATWSHTGIDVTTSEGTSRVSQESFLLTWQSLTQMGILAAENFPGEAHYRRAAISALLAMLPYIEFTTYPRITLFLRAHRFTNAQLSETFKVGTQRGIRLAGRSPETKLVVFITGEEDQSKADHPYHDRWEGDTFYYTGEGLKGPQEMSHGNLALKNSINQGFPVYGYKKLISGGYSFMGRFKVKAVHEEEQSDEDGLRRRVFIFEMQREIASSRLDVSRTDGNGTPTPHEPPRYYRIAAPSAPLAWAWCKESSALCLDGWDSLNGLSSYTTVSDLASRVAQVLSPEYRAVPSMVRRRADELWTARELRAGDRIIVSRGTSTVLGVAEVGAPGYNWSEERVEAKHTIGLNWISLGMRRIAKQRSWSLGAVSSISQELHDSIMSTPALPGEPRLDLEAVVREFGAALRASGIAFGQRHDEVVRSFVASLATKRFVILTGQSGSGKTQIALRFGDWLGEEHRMVIPVRPDWTGPDALFGYEDALKPLVEGHRVWHVPPVLAFMLKAARDPEHPFLLVLDEMNLAHVERYFADFLSGMESDEACLPNLVQDGQGNWLVTVGAPAYIPIPENLLVVGTVNIDETTYMFSPKVLDRANTFEFRVQTEDLVVSRHRPLPLEPGQPDLVRGFLAVACDDTWHEVHSPQKRDEFAQYFQQVHRLLSQGDFEFGHRTFYEALRYASMLASCGEATLEAALDQQVYQKVLPRLHGSRKRLEPTLQALGKFCFDLTESPTKSGVNTFDPEAPGNGPAKLPLSFGKILRMLRSLRVNQFTSFTE